MSNSKKFGCGLGIVLFLLILAGSLYLLVSWFADRFDLPGSAKTATTKYGWNLILVNTEYKIPDDLEIELLELTNGECVDVRIYPELQQMFDDMRDQGIYPTVSSGYRTSEYQQMLMEDKIERFIYEGYDRNAAKMEAAKWVAKVGYSEHQTGLAVDICSDDDYSSDDEEVYTWLAENAWRYGFIYRYPENKEDITGISCEPWHYRYVGQEAAEVIYEQDLCLEEYIEMYCR